MKPICLPPWAARAASTMAAVAFLALAAPSAARDVVIPFDAGDFPGTPTFTNPFWFAPGTTYVYRTGTDEDCEEVTIEVTDEIESVAGVNTLIVRETDAEDPECDGAPVVVERTDDYHAQDADGNVWYFGEATFDCDASGTCTEGEGSWRADDPGARPGIIMLADPRNGDEYEEEFLEDVAEDVGKVIGTNVWVSLYRDDAFDDPGDFQHCLKIRDTNRLEPGAVEHKFYCRAVEDFPGGLVAIDELQGGTVRYELVDVVD